MDAPAVKNMEMWKVEALERTIDFRNGAFVNTGVGFNCTAVNTFLQDLQNRVCFDFLYDLEGYQTEYYTEKVGDQEVRFNDYSNIGSGLVGNGGIRLTAMYVSITAILTWLSIIGTLGLKDGWNLNRGAEIVDVSEIKLLKRAEKGLGKSTDIESLDEGWVQDPNQAGRLVKKFSKGKRTNPITHNIGYSEQEPSKQQTLEESLPERHEGDAFNFEIKQNKDEVENEKDQEDEEDNIFKFRKKKVSVSLPPISQKPKKKTKIKKGAIAE